MKINVAVLFGGKSVEHEISVISALQAMNNINTEKYEVFPIYITKNNEFFYGETLKDINEFKNVTALLKKCTQISFATQKNKTYIMPNEQKLFGKNKHIALIDIAFPIVHGTNTEDGTLQGFLKMLNLPFVGCDILSSSVCMDKFDSKILLKNAGVPVLDALRFTFADYAEVEGIITNIEKKLGFPVIIKPINLGSSIGISRALNREELKDALDTAFSFADKIIAEPAVQNLKEINVSVLGGFDKAEASECEEPVATEKILSYSDKYLDNGEKSGGSKGMAGLKRKIPADIPNDIREKIRETAIEAFKLLDCNGVVRIDFLMDSKTNEFWLNEFNTIPGSLAFYLWEPTGLRYTDLLDRLIKLALERQRREEEITYSFDTNILSSGKSFGSKGSKGKL